MNKAELATTVVDAPAFQKYGKYVEIMRQVESLPKGKALRIEIGDRESLLIRNTIYVEARRRNLPVSVRSIRSEPNCLYVMKRVK